MESWRGKQGKGGCMLVLHAHEVLRSAKLLKADECIPQDCTLSCKCLVSVSAL